MGFAEASGEMLVNHLAVYSFFKVRWYLWLQREHAKGQEEKDKTEKDYRGPMLSVLQEYMHAKLPDTSSKKIKVLRGSARMLGDELGIRRMLCAVEVPGLMEGRPKLVIGTAEMRVCVLVCIYVYEYIYIFCMCTCMLYLHVDFVSMHVQYICPCVCLQGKNRRAYDPWHACLAV